MRITQIIEDTAGRLSSKRVAGFVTLGFGLMLKGYCSLLLSLSKMPVSSFDKIDASANTVLTLCGGLLGVGVVEKFGKNNDKNVNNNN